MKSHSFHSYVLRNTARALTGMGTKTIAIVLSLSMTALSAQETRKAPDPGAGGLKISLVESAPIPGTSVSENATAVSSRWALALFENLADNRRIPFKSTAFKYSGTCFARAEEMRRLLEKKGVKPMKIWAFGEPGQPLNFREPSSNDIMLPWDYHVAVVLPVLTANGQKKLYVLDPGIFDGPAEISEWSQRIGANPQRIRLTAPDNIPSEYFDITNKLKIPYTKDDYTQRIAREFGHYYNTRTVRHVYKAKLREELCRSREDAAACKERGQTWVGETPSPVIFKLPNYPQAFSMHF